MTTARLDIIPPRRLGTLLAEARRRHGLTLADVAGSGPLDEAALAAVEAGDAVVPDDELHAVLAGYRTTLDELLPARAQVVLDLERGRLLVADEVTELDGAPTPDEVLGAYLSLVYALRRAEPGTPVVLRGFDVAVLARALDLAEPEVERRLERLMVAPSAEVNRLTRLLRNKLAVPIVGAVVVATALGTVLVLRDDGSTTPPPTGVSRTEVPQPELAPAASQGRNADGSVGPVVERGE